jgi:glycosyltransferase involved in cell wall biosynthesis
MIVKNESAIIERCLRSLAGVIDHYVICDTGSTDGTADLVMQRCASLGIPGSLHHVPFENFEITRNCALDLCRQEPADFDYILLTDADMELIVADPGFKSGLSAGAYAVRQTNSISYENVRLIRRSRAARYVGVTHEYLDVADAVVPLPAIWFLDHACGANRSDKSARDIHLLGEALSRNPADVRSMFYLAQSYRDAGQYQDAIEWYENRAASGGWDEEVWYSLYMIAACYESLGMRDATVEACDRALRKRPTRIEPLLLRARQHRVKQDFETCMTDCQSAKGILRPDSDNLFVDVRAYEVGADEIMSVAGYYCTDEHSKALGRAATARLMTSRGCDAGTRALAARNSFYYAKGCRELFGECRFATLEVAVAPGYSPANPSIWIDERGLQCVVRSVNYRVENMHYHIEDGDKVVRTQNYFLRLGHGLDVVSARPMADWTAGPRVASAAIEGFEDCRLFSCRGRLWCVCTVCDRNPDGRCEIAVLDLDANQDIVGCRVIRSMAPDSHQKNWIPLVRGNDLFFIYAHDPTTVLSYDFDSGEAAVVYYGRPGPCLESFRGSSQAIRVRDRWIYVVHEAHAIDAQTRFYCHRFVTMGDDFHIHAFSEPFYFQHKGIEFCAGLAHDPSERRFIASFGVDDRRACLVSLGEDAVFASLQPALDLRHRGAA